MILKSIVLLSLMAMCLADLRMASQPKNAWAVQQRSRTVLFQRKYPLYMEPSDFNYQGLKNQRDGGGYDNFLRSNIDNEQDRRNFNTEFGEDHLPFRSFETANNDRQSTVKHKMKPASAEATGVTEAGDYIMVAPGEPYVVPLRWNNPHASELEVNIWIFTQNDGPYVVPILKPQCSGEGYQDNAFTFTVPTDFNNKAACTKTGDCILQVYAHSVESRMYASGTPIIISGGTANTWAPGTIQEPAEDVAFDLSKLRRLCLPASDPANTADHTTTVVYKARLSSDVYNHAYQNSDFSPYAGQQPQHISQNLQASCILKMTVGNFGELGKQYVAKTANDARKYASQLDKKARSLIRVYETITNSIIEAIKDDVANSDTLKFASPPAGYTECTEWRDRYDRTVGGRLRGLDRDGGYCPANYTCLCTQDCYGPGSEQDGYCGKLEPRDEDDPTNGFQTIVAGSRIERTGYSPQKTETCFRCAEVGSTVVRRHNTNTYIPSFEIHGSSAVNKALQYIAPIYLKNGFFTNPDDGAITQKGDDNAILQIYMAVLSEMWPEFVNASNGNYLELYYKRTYDRLPEPKNTSLEKYKFTYRGPVYKTTTTTLSDENGGVDQKFRKLDENNNQDRGYYSAAKAWYLQNRETGSSTAVPETAGPLNDDNIVQSVNHADGRLSPNTNTLKVQIPPAEEQNTAACAYVEADAANTADTTPEGEDMDGLNRDADCDDDTWVEAQYEAYLKECYLLQEDDETIICDGSNYTEPECHIEGEDDLLPTQLFTNNNNDEIGSASGVLPSYVAVLSILSFLALFL